MAPNKTRRLVFADDASAVKARALLAPGDVFVPMVVREQDLHTYSALELTPDDLAAVAADSAQLMADWGERLRTRIPQSHGNLPDFWSCFGEHLRSWAAAPLLANALVARRAGQLYSPHAILVREDPRRPTWWLCRQQIADAVADALPDCALTLHPGTALRRLRRHLGPSLARIVGARERSADGRAWAAVRSRFPEPRATDVLFLPVGRTCVPIIDRLAEPLSASGLRCAALIAAPSDLGMGLRAHGSVPYQFLAHFHRPANPGPLHPLCTELGAEASQTTRPLRAALALRLLIAFSRDGERMLADREAALRVLDLYRPRVIVAFHLYWHRIAPIILAARKRGVPVLYVQHGVYLAQDECIRPLPYDEYLVFGEAAAQTISCKPLTGPVTPVGHCLYDDLASVPASPARAARTRTVLVATQPDETQVSDVSSQRWWLRGVVQACHELGARVRIKLHPRETDTSHYDALSERWPHVVQVLNHSEGALPALLAEADVLVTRDSTVVFEGNLLGVPVITVNLTGQRDRFPFAADGGAIGVYDYESIAPVLAEVLASGAPTLVRTRPAFIARHLGPGDGKATDRIVQAILRAASSCTIDR